MADNKRDTTRSGIAFVFIVILGYALGLLIKRVHIGIIIGIVLGLLLGVIGPGILRKR
jgi:hypothetical protein